MTPSRPAQPTCTAIVCAYNEEKYLSGVITGLLDTPAVQEIIVVDDGSQDSTADILHQFEREGQIRAIYLSPNRGKGYAMAEGAAAACGDILLFVDADLVNWDGNYAAQVLSPLHAGQADMVIGYPRLDTDPDDVFGTLHWLSGERAIWRSDLMPILSKLRPSRFGVETLINMHYRTQHQPIRIIDLDGLQHVIKLEKSSLAEAWHEYAKEVWQIVRTYARHPLMTVMTYVPDFIDLRDAFRNLRRRSLSFLR